jgi:hypothetical protein
MKDEDRVKPNEHGSFIDDDIERIAVHLILGRRKPQNKWEEEFLAEIEEMGKEGKVIEIPFN